MPSLNKNHFGDPRYFLWCLLFFSQLTAYKAFAQVKYAFTKDTVAIKGGQTFTNILQVSNPYGQAVTLIQDPREKTMVRGLISLPDTLQLKAGESRNFFVKYIADRQTITSNMEVFAAHLIALKAGVPVQKSAGFIAQLTDVTGLTIGTEENEIYLSQLSNQAQVVVRVANNGFVPLTFRILLTGVPDGLEFTGQTMNLTLQPGSQQLLPFLARNKSANPATDFTVTMQAMDASNHQLATKVIRILNVTSARRMSGGNSQSGGSMLNTVSLSYATLNRNSSYYQLQANGEITTGAQSTLDYRLSADDYHQPDASGMNVYNSYLDYQARYWGLKVGSIYDNLDFQLSGNGVKASAKLDGKGTLSFYGIQNNYFLYNQLGNTTKGARVYAVDYDLDRPYTQAKLTVLHSSDPLTGLDANQVSGKTTLKLGKTQTLGFEGGYSRESQTANSSILQQGYSGGLNYTLHTDDYQFSGNGYYSSPYFTGLRRGLFLSDIRLARKAGEHGSLIAHVNLQNSNPKYQDRLNNIFNLGVNKSAINIYELGYSTKAGKVYLNFNPYYMDQHLIAKGFSELIPMPTNWRSSSFRFAANVGYGGALSSFSLTADYGYTFLNTSEKPPAPFHSLKVTGSYNMPILGFTSFIQLNPFYLSDALSSTGENNHYRLYSGGPNIHFNALKNTLSVRFSGMYNYYGFTTSNNYSASGNFRYLLKGHWALTGDVQYILTKQSATSILQDQATMGTANTIINPQLSYQNRQIRFGIEKQFGRQGNTSLKKLTLAYYEDRNNNGKRDIGEPPVSGVLVKINNDAALTNGKGEVVFSDMKKEGYSVSVTNTRGWSLQEPTDVFLDKNKSLEIPLVKTQALNGVVKPVASKYLNGKPALAGIRVSARDGNGRIHETLTDDLGGFCFYLPRNKYTVYIETEGMPFSIENGKEEVLLEGAPVEMLTFLYKDEHRKIEVTRF